jgi:hypothetical protein
MKEDIVSMIRFALSSLVVAVVTLGSGCVFEHEHEHEHGYHEGYREGYYDREHRRWWHEHAWRECIENDEHCH